MTSAALFPAEDVAGEPHRARILLVANAYPSDSALYRNGFIHRRVRAYLDAGLDIEVFYLHPPVAETYTYEFDSVHVTVGNGAHYAAFVEESPPEVLLVHFAQPAMTEPLLRHSPGTRVIVWVHGFEAEAWHRRWFNMIDDATEVSSGLARRDAFRAQLEYIGWLISTDELDVTTVHVSDWFRRNIVEPDTRTATRRPVIIPNVIDDRIFRHYGKPTSQRTAILSIRPYASRKYANDLTVKAILELAKRPYFADLSFTLRGAGPLFDRTVAPLRGMKNVDVQQGFLRQEDVADLHRSHGVFLAPTRFDSQGVSMGEAMSSGLVPVSSRVAAVPEFVEHRVSGLLTPAEDPLALADALEALYYDPELFGELSAAAAESARRQCGYDATIAREIELIGAAL